MQRSMRIKQRGSTIVELLIAAIGTSAVTTVVAYRGMHQRATITAVAPAVDKWEN